MTWILQAGQGNAAIYIGSIAKNGRSYTLTGDKRAARRFRSPKTADRAAGSIYALSKWAPPGSLSVVQYKPPPPDKRFLIIVEEIGGGRSKHTGNNLDKFMGLDWVRQVRWNSIFIKNLEEYNGRKK